MIGLDLTQIAPTALVDNLSACSDIPSQTMAFAFSSGALKQYTSWCWHFRIVFQITSVDLGFEG